jgi:invasion protein IalB
MKSTVSPIQLRAARAAALAFTLLCAGGTVAVTALPAAAQMNSGGIPSYYDGSNDEPMRRGVSGTIASSSPYRVLLSVSDERTVNVDLEHGTVILPTGVSLQAGMHVDIRGHWSAGTFIAESVHIQS